MERIWGSAIDSGRGASSVDGTKTENEAMQKSASCSFCRQSSRDAGPLIEGPERGEFRRAYICGNCAELCTAILEKEKQKRAAAEPTESAAKPAKPVESIEDAVARWSRMIDLLLRKLTESERAVVRSLHGLGDGYGHTAEEVAEMLNMTPEAVQENETQAMNKLRSR
jgi:DNA-directed RNA polymerase specialized sigma24 family protein